MSCPGRLNQVQGAVLFGRERRHRRVEQSIQHGQQRLRQLQDDLREAEQARLETESHLSHDRTLLATLDEELAMRQARARGWPARRRRSPRLELKESGNLDAGLAGAMGALQSAQCRAASGG